MKELLAVAVATRFSPDVVITHNEAGEYGHCYHKVVHRVCCQVFDREKLYFIGAGMPANGHDRDRRPLRRGKEKAIDGLLSDLRPRRFSPSGSSARLTTYQPETYIAARDQRPPSGAADANRHCRRVDAGFHCIFGFASSAPRWRGTDMRIMEIISGSLVNGAMAHCAC